MPSFRFSAKLLVIPQQVLREVAVVVHVIELLQGTKTLLWPGIDIDIPTAATSSKSSPDGTKEAVIAAFRAGSDGVILFMEGSP